MKKDYSKWEQEFGFTIATIPSFKMVQCMKCGSYYFQTDGCPICAFNEVLHEKRG